MKPGSMSPALLLAAALFCAGAVHAVETGDTAHAVETGDITLTQGYVDPKTGIVVEKVETDPRTGLQQITFRVPRKYGEIEEIVVHGRRPEREPLKQARRYEKVNDQNHDYYGYVVYLGEHEDVPVRLFMDARQDQQGRITPP